MRFAHGATRWVVLTRRYAIKIARFRIVRRAGLRSLAWGIWANRAEYRLYKQHGSSLLAPTLLTIGWIINVQRRGEQAKEEDLQKHYFWNILKGTPLGNEVLRAEQFCIIDTQVCLADYGGNNLGKYLIENDATLGIQ